ncbi:MAG: aminoglycoside phosphotransferase family protein [Anaerolineae bacterium]|nr:aminoglycoside phosphotransferase family protein [Anaerolineae bacterium]
MLEKPDIADAALVACLRDDYGVLASRVDFLPLGADANTAVYRVTTDDRAPLFLKLRRGDFHELVVTVPHWLSQQGVPHLIPPLATTTGGLWTRVDHFTATLYPFVAGWNGYKTTPLDRHWVELGAALQGIHTATLPPALAQAIPRETYSPTWRHMVKGFQAQAEETLFEEPVAARCAAFIKAQRATIDDLVSRADRLALALQERPLPAVLCHADIHAGNLLISDTADLYIVDWDTLILAPKERDLMYVGAGLSICDSPGQAALFYEGYGPTEPDPAALAYYRYERIVQDIAAFCQQLLLTDEGGADREQSLGYLASSFLPGYVVNRAYALDKSAQNRAQS